MWDWLRNLAARPRLPHVTITLYTRRGCHLCDVAWERLRRERRRHGFRLSAVDVDGDPDLVRQYGSVVPVVTVNGKVRFRGVVHPALLARLLTAEARSAPTTG